MTINLNQKSRNHYINMQYLYDNISFIEDDKRALIEEQIKADYWPHIRAKGYSILVKPYIRPTTVDGIAIPESMRFEDGHHSVASQVLDIGPVAYTDKDVCGELRWASIGEWVIIPRVAGVRVARKINGEDVIFRLVKEDDILAVINDPTEWEIRITQTRY